MKNVRYIHIIVFFTSLLLSFDSLYAQDYSSRRQNFRQEQKSRRNSAQSKDGYSIRNNKVYYMGDLLRADTYTFQILDSGYAKDRKTVFFRGREIRDAISTTFTVLTYGYAKDLRNAYFKGVRIPNVLINSFEVEDKGYAKDAKFRYFNGNQLGGLNLKLDDYKKPTTTDLGDGYTKDKWTIYYNGKEIKEATPISFKTLGNGYAKDNWNVYYKGVKIDEANSDTFKVLDDKEYSSDEWNVYYNGRLVKYADTKSFKTSKDGNAKDKQNQYFKGDRINNGNTSSKRNAYVDLGYGYSEDDWNIYYRDRPIEDVDYDSFRIMYDGYAKDSWNVYYRGVLVAGADSRTFFVEEDGYARDAWNLYYQGRKVR